MSTGGGDFERALAALLALDVLEVDQRVADLADFRLRPGQHLRAAKVIGELDEGAGGDDLHFGACPGGFGAAGRGADQTFAAPIGADGRRQYARHGRDRAVEAEFAEHCEARKSIRRNGADGGHQPERDRQVVVAAFLGQVGGREVDGDAACGERQA